MEKTALVIGATGLVGRQLVKLLLEDERYAWIKVFARRPTGFSSNKLEEHLVDFGQIETWKDQITGDVVFSAMGTTLAKAGSRKAQYLIDYTYQFEFAKAARQNGVLACVLVSSMGADARSKIFYLRMKGEMEEAAKSLNFSTCIVLRPGPLTGKREEFRFGERLGIGAVRIANKLGFFKLYRPITGEQAAKAMIMAADFSPKGFEVLDSSTLFHLAGIHNM